MDEPLVWQQQQSLPRRFQTIIPSVRVKPQSEFIEDLEQLASEGCKGQRMGLGWVWVRCMNCRRWRVEEFGRG